MASYADFKSYIQDNYGELIARKIKDKLKAPAIRTTRNTHSLSDIDVQGVEISSMKCRAEGTYGVYIVASVNATIITMALGNRNVIESCRAGWFKVDISLELNDGVKNFDVVSVRDGYFEDYRVSEEEGMLDPFLVPYIKAEQLEDIADRFADEYVDKHLSMNSYQLPWSAVLRDMGVKAYEANLPGVEMGRMYFRESQAEYIENYNGKRTVKNEIVPPGTMLIDQQHYFVGTGNSLNTIAHEMVHWYLHRRFFELLKLLGKDNSNLSCTSEPVVDPENLSGIEKAIWYAEWQANNLAPRIMMPRATFEQVFDDTYGEICEYDFHTRGQVMQDAIEKVAELFGTTDYAVKIRALQLGYDDADATLLHYNGHIYLPMSFERGSLGKYQTYFIGAADVAQLREASAEFDELFTSGRYVYAECVICINDSMFVEKDDSLYNESGYKVRDEFKWHLDECCLKVDREFISQSGTNIEYYGQCYLRSDLRVGNYFKVSSIDMEDNQDVDEKARELKKLLENADTVSEFIGNSPSSFAGTLDKQVSIATYKDRNGTKRKMSSFELAQRTGYSEEYIRRLRKNRDENPSFQCVCGLALALHQSPILSDDLIKKAGGYPDTKEGVVAKFILTNNNTDDLTIVNDRLREANLPTWGKDENLAR